MAKILPDSQLFEYYKEAMQNHSFLDTLNKYELEKLLKFCPGGSKRLIQKLAIYDNARDSRSAQINILSTSLRLETRIRQLLNKGDVVVNLEIPKKAATVKLAYNRPEQKIKEFTSFIMIEDANILSKIFKNYKGAKCSKLIPFIFALILKGILEARFITQTQVDIHKQLAVAFDLKVSGSGFSSMYNKWESKYRAKSNDYKIFISEIESMMKS